MQTRITGTTMPVLEFSLDHNDAIISEAGELSWMSASIQMATHTQFAGGGGIFGAIKRVAGGGSLFMTEYRAFGAPGELAFATRVPGHIVPVSVGNSPNGPQEYLVHRHGFLCATAGIELGVGFQQSLGAGIFGGDGFRLQKISGQGLAWLNSPVRSSSKTSLPAKPSASTPATSAPFSPRSPFRSSASPASAT
jgi:uncharacterized protein (AIM24 family)